MPKLYVVTGPSGTGLSDTLAALFRLRPDLSSVLPVTSRRMKEGETDGVGFRFYDLEAWSALKDAGGLLETTEFAGNDYGTSRKLVNAALEQGHDVLLNLPVERAKQLKANMPEAVCLYVEPSEAVLKARYEAIARSGFELSVRLEQAEKERALASFCDGRICSDEKDRAVEQILAEMQD
jgi:guanylate kinase